MLNTSTEIGTDVFTSKCLHTVWLLIDILNITPGIKLTAYYTSFQLMKQVRHRWSCGYHTCHWIRGLQPDPARVSGFFKSGKILCMTSFSWEVSRGSRVIDLRHVKEPQACCCCSTAAAAVAATAAAKQVNQKSCTSDIKLILEVRS